MAVFEFVAKDLHHSGHHKLAEFDCFLLTIMKLRLNLNHYDLAFRFGICQTTAGRIFKKWIFLMHSRMGDTLIKWPSRESLQRTMPFCFRAHYGLKVTAIIDCFELFIEKPSNLMARACTWSQYKHYNTAKYLIAVTPQGVQGRIQIFEKGDTETGKILGLKQGSGGRSPPEAIGLFILRSTKMLLNATFVQQCLR